MTHLLGCVGSPVIVTRAVIPSQPFRKDPFKRNVKYVVFIRRHFLCQLYHHEIILDISGHFGYWQLLKLKIKINQKQKKQ